MKKSELLKRLQHNTAQRDRLNEEIALIEKQLEEFSKGESSEGESLRQNARRDLGKVRGAEQFRHNQETTQTPKKQEVSSKKEVNTSSEKVTNPSIKKETTKKETTKK